MRSAAVFGLMLMFAMPAAAATAPSTDPANESLATAAAPPAKDAELTEPAVMELLQSYELFGTFAPDCSRPAAPTNPHVRVSREPGGMVIEAHDVGLKYSNNLYSVRAARRVAADRLELKVVFVPGTKAEEYQTMEMVVGKGTRRTMFNRVDNGPVRVQRGVAVANGSRTPLLKKCD